MSQLIDNYYLSLGEVMFAFGFLVGIKVVFGYVMSAVLKILRDEPAQADNRENKPEQRVAASAQDLQNFGRHTLWVGLAGIWLYSGVIQILPMMVVVAKDRYVNSVISYDPGFVTTCIQWFSNYWFFDPTAANILSVLVQFSLALLLYLGREHFVGKIGLWVSMGLAFLDWVVGESFGRLFAISHDSVSGFPGAALLVMFLSILLLLPRKWWEKGRALRFGSRVLGGLFLLVALSQLVHMGGRSSSMHLTGQVVSSSLTPEFIFLSHIWLIRTFEYHSEWISVALFLIFALGAYVSVRALERRVLVYFLIVFLLFVWWMIESFGVAPHYLLNIGMVPGFVIVLWAFHRTKQHANKYKKGVTADGYDK
ncbi:hypothetical protein [Sulfoacidibacillus thermotolerans]|uniref:Uncharacterized protein n=1 Tax=Sulfoacidibacillus thermotolerans TaxID=1765684 RepID=A0A2U3D819_SULT2|nr:hypothetical protein [Sulfoacidibacillus thermotolerans]PWI57399.1 hypothetical protein BM613_08725 [Sulfoacidibacillus thermotolerans]